MTLRELISDGRSESNNQWLHRKPEFLSEDTIIEDEEDLYDRNYKWLRQIGNNCFFLPKMEHIFLLSCQQFMSLCLYMDWELIKAQLDVSIRRITNSANFPIGHSREMFELLPGSMKQKFSTRKTPKQAETFINRFIEVKDEFPKSYFQAPKWVNSSKATNERGQSSSSSESWRSHCFSTGCTMPSGPYRARLPQVIIISSPCMLSTTQSPAPSSPWSERWGLPCMRCSKSLGYPWDLPYEEYILRTEELHLMNKEVLRVYETYWEVLCHFHICAPVSYTHLTLPTIYSV